MPEKLFSSAFYALPQISGEAQERIDLLPILFLGSEGPQAARPAVVLSKGRPRLGKDM